jgi:BirA family biotin operon repressor/biotin-[acetyl-CoA-carboxylase] ligase
MTSQAPSVQHLSWRAEALWRQLEPLLPGLSVEVLARCDSTNTQLLDRARLSSGKRDQPITTPGVLEPLAPVSEATPHGRRADDSQPCLLVAEHQTRGRGRLGRQWQSSVGCSLTFSLGMTLTPCDWSGLSLAVGVALADALDPAGSSGPPRVGLKWPNDLWLLDSPGAGRKLGGVLIETVTVGRNRMMVVGVGLNVLPQPTRELSNGYACLQEIDAQASAPETLHRVALPLVEALLRYEREGYAAFADRYAARDLLRGRRVATTSALAARGTALGVGRDGALQVRDDEGTVHAIASGEVSVTMPGELEATGGGSGVRDEEGNGGDSDERSGGSDARDNPPIDEAAPRPGPA